MRNINSFAAAVERWRRERGVTLGQLAGMTSYSASYLSKMLHGWRPLLPAAVSEIDRALSAGGELEWLAKQQRVGENAPIRPMQLPATVPGFVGRAEQLRRIDVAVGKRGEAVLVAIEGEYWVGKTALAVQWAANAVHGYPGGCLFADLRGLAPGRPLTSESALDGFLRTLGADAAQLEAPLPDKAAYYRSLLSRRPAIVVLDNIGSYEQVKDLLPGAGSVVLTTSREHQDALLMKTGGFRLVVPPLNRQESLTLLRKRTSDARVDADPGSADLVVETCGGLPMAISIAAEQLARRRPPTLQRLAAELIDENRVLDVFTSSDREINIHGTIDLSYLALPPRSARLFRLLGISPVRDIAPAGIAALAAVDEDTASDALSALRRAHLIEETPAGRIRMSPLTRAYAYLHGLVDEPLSEVERARDRVIRWYASSAAAASAALMPGWLGRQAPSRENFGVRPATFTGDYDAAMSWCATEAATVINLVRSARSVSAGDALWQLAAAFLPYFHLSKDWTAWLTLATAGLDAARAVENPAGLVRCLQNLGWALHELGRDHEALERFEQAAQAHCDDTDDGCRAWTTLGTASAFAALNRLEEARDTFARAEQLFFSADCTFGAVLALSMAAPVHQRLSDTTRADISAAAALAQARKLASKPLLGSVHHHRGLMLRQRHALRPALAEFDAALALRRTGRDCWAQAQTHVARAETFTELGEIAAARDAYSQAAHILDGLRDPQGTDVRARIALLAQQKARP
ncbi:NB-ARC domain-containing protein [Amycolatopsis roodepoortensis]|uniref:XRE family transcriptional regulator n=1 Tax=Amycolatopsis roodepoortensis TaxID=700274 RepID=UPI00214AD61B|nr:XRE family transcriptional regulator [Amycolatopsis roodepoortensis]UUV28558.1 NB-ARC domain-containing protein [Amycolatopsis roodepoortensis]